MKQAEAFLQGEGTNWLKRNIKKLGEPDPVLDAITTYNIQPRNVLEVGCANGWRLERLRKKFGDCLVGGIDPSVPVQVMDGRLFMERGTADKLSHSDKAVDLLIYGWCLYLCDPEDYFKIAAEGDRVLEDGGYLIIYDFSAETTYKTPYKHKNGLFSYHYDFSKLWLSHPAYSLYGRTVQNTTSVTILKKSMKDAFK